MKAFVDIQFNGWMGKSFSEMDLTLDMIRATTRDLVARGTAAYCPTVVTGPMDMYRRNLPLIAKAMREPELQGRLLGIHMEGPFISPAPGARGVHPQQYVRVPSIQEFDQLMEWADGKIVLLTVAAERPGAIALIRHAVQRGVVVSVGHQLADDQALEHARSAGATACTHVANGIPNQIHRHQNPIWWQLADDDMWGLFITDGQHLPAALVKVAFRAKTVNRFVVTSDASPLAGMPPGRYHAFGLTVVINAAGRIFAEETQGLAGSHATMIECLNWLASLGVLTETELWQVALTNPLRVIGRTIADLAGLQGPAVVFRAGRFEVV